MSATLKEFYLPLLRYPVVETLCFNHKEVGFGALSSFLLSPPSHLLLSLPLPPPPFFSLVFLFVCRYCEAEGRWWNICVHCKDRSPPKAPSDWFNKELNGQ